MANVVATLTAKFEKGLMPKIRNILEEETESAYEILSSSVSNGGFWAYDYKNKSKAESEHSYANWHWDIVREKSKIKTVIWNDTHLRNYYNYVAGIAHRDLSPNTSSDEYAYIIKAMKESIKTRIKSLKGIK